MTLGGLERRNFLRRKDGAFKKAFELQKRFGANVAMIVVIDGQWFVYRSSDSKVWPSSMKQIVSALSGSGAHI